MLTLFFVFPDTGLSLGLLGAFIDDVDMAPVPLSFMSAEERSWGVERKNGGVWNKTYPSASVSFRGRKGLFYAASYLVTWGDHSKLCKAFK